MSSDVTLYHGGISGLWAGDTILPNMAHLRHHAGCAECERKAAGLRGIEPITPPDWVYATEDKEYARYYASMAGGRAGGALYRVRLDGDVERSDEDLFPSWRGRRAVVLGVPQPRVRLTMGDRRRLFRRWGGTDEEFAEMLVTAGLKRPGIPRRAP